MAAISAVMLVGFLTGFFFLDEFTQLLNELGIATVSGEDIVIATVGGFQLAISIPALRVFLAAGAVFFEFLIIIQVMSDRIFDTLRALIRPLIMLVPISFFFVSAFRTFEPIIRSLLPPELGGANPAYIASAASDDTLAKNLLITFGSMLLYLLLSAVFGSSASAEVRALKAELKKCREGRR